MITFEPFKAGHLVHFVPQPAQAREHAALLAAEGLAFLEQGIALSAWADARCVGAAGLVAVRPHRAVAWAVLSQAAGAYMIPIARKVRRVILASPFRRVEFTVAVGFAEGQRFAELIGAKQETPEPMRFFGADGGDEILYAVVKEGATWGC